MRFKMNFCFVALLTASLVINDASALIGKIGSPVVPSNVPPAPAAAAPISKPSATTHASEVKIGPEVSPLIVIDFDKKRVSFQKQLRQVLIANEAQAAGSDYSIMSLIPTSAGKIKNARLNDLYSANLNNVIAEMQANGVQPERIHTVVRASNKVDNQEIKIFAH